MLVRRGNSGIPGIIGSFFAFFACFAVKLCFSGLCGAVSSTEEAVAIEDSGDGLALFLRD